MFDYDWWKRTIHFKRCDIEAKMSTPPTAGWCGWRRTTTIASDSIIVIIRTMRSGSHAIILLYKSHRSQPYAFKSKTVLRTSHLQFDCLISSHRLHMPIIATVVQRRRRWHQLCDYDENYCIYSSADGFVNTYCVSVQSNFWRKKVLFIHKVVHNYHKSTARTFSHDYAKLMIFRHSRKAVDVDNESRWKFAQTLLVVVGWIFVYEISSNLSNATKSCTQRSV